MLTTTYLLILAFSALVGAHFQLQFPPPRGVFVEDDEPKFCDGYDNAASNRTVFPLTGGFFSLNSEHNSWTAGVSLSTKANPATFQDFSTIVPFFQLSGEGLFCLPLDLMSTNATGLTDGQNVTLEIMFNGGDGELFQCADLMLSSTAKIASTVSCTNGTSSSASGIPTPPQPSGAGATSPPLSGAGAATDSATSPGSSSTSAPPPSSALSPHLSGGYMSLVVAVVGIAVLLV